MPEPASGGFLKTLMSPPVILAGVAIGAVLLISGKGSAGASSSGGGGSSSYGHDVLGATVTMNEAALQAQTTQAQIAAGLGADQYGQDTQRQANLLGFLANINNSNNVLSGQIVNANAGITNTQITTAAAYAEDINNNYTRLGLAYVGANIAEAGDRSNVAIATINASAAKDIAQQQAIGGIFSSLVGGATRIATGGFMGGDGFASGGMPVDIALNTHG